MHLFQPGLTSRRAFLKRAGQLAASGTALPIALNLAALSDAAAFNNPGDYKA
ncbi:MAG: Tat pathway signal protein, partial [Betaproteobacteria bacterium]|nr:Tat pathway signal protein [Betaproteobacteria bacterium]